MKKYLVLVGIVAVLTTGCANVFKCIDTFGAAYEKQKQIEIVKDSNRKINKNKNAISTGNTYKGQKPAYKEEKPVKRPISEVKSKLDSLAMSALRAGEKRNEEAVNSYANQMFDLGIDSLYSPVIAVRPTPNCPLKEIELNGRILTGSLCAKMGYIYDGKTYWVGYCKP